MCICCIFLTNIVVTLQQCNHYHILIIIRIIIIIIICHSQLYMQGLYVQDELSFSLPCTFISIRISMTYGHKYA